MDANDRLSLAERADDLTREALAMLNRPREIVLLQNLAAKALKPMFDLVDSARAGETRVAEIKFLAARATLPLSISPKLPLSPECSWNAMPWPCNGLPVS